MPVMTMKKGERVRWYVLTMGEFGNIHTPHWHGNVVLHEGHRTDVILIGSCTNGNGGYGSRQPWYLDVSLSRRRTHADGNDRAV